MSIPVVRYSKPLIVSKSAVKDIALLCFSVGYGLEVPIVSAPKSNKSISKPMDIRFYKTDLEEGDPVKFQNVSGNLPYLNG